MTSREVTLEGGSPWGFRMHGGVDVHQPLRISRVNPGSKASLKGVRDGDLITSINGLSTKEITNSGAHTLLKSAGDRLILGLNEDGHHSPKRRPYKTILHHHREEVVQESHKTSSSSSHTTLITTNSPQEHFNDKENKNENCQELIKADKPKSRNPFYEELQREKVKLQDNKHKSKENGSSTQANDHLINITNDDEDALSEYERFVDETPCVSTVTPTPTLSPTSSHYSSDTKGLQETSDASFPEEETIKVDPIPTSYRVESPIPTTQSSPTTTTKSLAKSKSFDSADNLDTLKITELKSGDDLSADVLSADQVESPVILCNSAIISEADCDVDWETTDDLHHDPLAHSNKLTKQEEDQLRYFIDKLNLPGVNNVNSRVDEEASGPSGISKEKKTSIAIKAERNERRQELMQFFAPVYNNPRFLEAISEEGGDDGGSVVPKIETVQRGEAEIVILDSSSASVSGDDEIADAVVATPPPSPDKSSKTESDIESEIAEVAEKILQTEKNIEHDQNLIDELQTSLEQDQKDIQMAQDEVEHLKSFEREFKDVLQQKRRISPSPSRSTDSSNSSKSSLGTTVLYNPSLKDFAGLEELQKTLTSPLSLKEVCLKLLVELPFGQDALEELAEVSDSLKDFTDSLPKVAQQIFPKEETISEQTSEELHKVVDLSASKKLLDIIMKEKLEGPAEEEILEDLKELHEARLARAAKTLPKRLQSAQDCETDGNRRRRRSLPPELHVKQMQYLIEKEKLIQSELEQLEGAKRRLLNQMERTPAPAPAEEVRQRMYEEYQRQLAEREQRKLAKVIRISLAANDQDTWSETAGGKKAEFNEIEKEFMDIVRLREKNGNGKCHNEEDEEESSAEQGETVLVLDGDELSAKKVPKHLQEFINLSGEKSTGKIGEEDVDDGIWSPGQKTSFDRDELHRESTQLTSQESLRSDEGPPVFWTPKSAGSSPTAERKEFRPVTFESPVLGRKTRTKSDGSANAEPPWKSRENGRVLNEPQLPTSQSADEFTQRLPRAQNPTITLLQKARERQIPPKSAAYVDQERRSCRRNESPYNSQSDLIFNLPTESDSEGERPHLHQQVTPAHGMPTGLQSDIRDANMSQWYKRVYDTIHKHQPSKYDDEEYVTIRYKQRNRGRYPFATGYLSEPEAGGYDSDDKYATLDRRRTPYQTFSNTNIAAFQNDPTVSTYNRYASSTLPTNVRSSEAIKRERSTSASVRESRTRQPEETTTIRYKPEVVQQSQSAIALNRPGKIANYTPGKSSISEHEAKKWWDEVMDIFDGWLDDNSSIYPSQTHSNYNLLDRNRIGLNRRPMEKNQQQQQQLRRKVPLVQPKGYLSQALKESGYESDSTLIFRRREENAQLLSPNEQREVYKNIQKGGDVPLHGLRKSVPDRPKDFDDVEIEQLMSPNRLRVANSPNRSRRQEIICYPVLSTHQEQDTFATYKRTAPSGLNTQNSKKSEKTSREKRPVTLVRKPPSPPRRKSSRNNSTLRMIHKVSDKSTPKRHESCFSHAKDPSTSSKVDSNVKSLREKITTKLSPVLGLGSSPRKSTASSSRRSYCTKGKSPTEVKDAVVTQINAMNGKSSSAILAKINGTKSKPTPKIVTHLRRPKVPSPVPSTQSTTSSRSTLKSTSMDSLRSTTKLKPRTKIILGKDTRTEPDSKVLPKKTKSKKELLNSQTKTSSSTLPKPKTNKLNGVSVNRSEFRQPIKEKAVYVPKPEELVRSSEGFFQQLFFGPDKCQRQHPTLTRSLLMPVRQTQGENRCDPTLGALKLYLSHTKPVTESKFKYLDMVRSRSSSPAFKRGDPHERSISLPPKLVFTQTSRPVTPTLDSRRLPLSIYNPRDPGPKIEKIIFSQTSRPVSPLVVRRSFRTPSPNPSPSPSEVLYFSETSRPVSPIVTRHGPPRPISPLYNPPGSPQVLRSPSYRRIKQKRPRAHSADVETRNSRKFKELNKFYQDLERLGELERTTSSTDLLPRRRFEDSIIDYDRWQEVRQRERAERELTSLCRQLKHSQDEHDFLFRPKSPSGTKWRRDLDRGLRIKERSVENLREEFEKIRKDQLETERKLKEELNIKRGVYKSLWRGNSVVNLAHTLTQERSKSESRAESVRQKIIDNEKLLTHGIGSRIWSSLSLEQVNILKNQLIEIYGNDKRFIKEVPQGKDLKDHSIEVALNKNKPPKELRVRRNSATERNFPIMRSKSATDPRHMTEDEKKKLSRTLSKEVLDLQLKKNRNVIQGKETRGAIAAAEAQLSDTPSPRTCYSLEVSEDDQKNADFLLVLTKDDSKAYKDSLNETLEIWARPKPPQPEVKTDCLTKFHERSETESGSTDGSTKTVIYQPPEPPTVPKEKILEKVEYFENKEKEVFTPTVYKAAGEPDDLGDTLIRKGSGEGLVRSQSNQDFRELYGESQLQRIAREPLSASRKVQYFRPNSPILRSSLRCRSLSPDCQYGPPTVNALKDKFEYFSTRGPRRCASDPQLAHHEGEKVSELRAKFEYPKITGRGRSRSRIRKTSFLKAEDRYMPHINIISKIASLYPNPKHFHGEVSRSSEDLARILGIPVGEVHKMRERFDAPDRHMSLLGHMFTSSPNINELRDVAQYLTGNWYAHKYPRAEESDVVARPRTKSASPTRPKNRLASILKLPTRNTNANKNPKKTNGRRFIPFRSWWSPKHSVHFKEPEGPPPPPLSHEHMKVSQVEENADLSTTESPRKYLENEVTIHYRTPVRQEVKEIVDEHELARRQADAMRKIYEEERHRKHLQVSHSDNELQDRRSRRHTDNFTPSQKSPIPLNRYDAFIEEMSSRQKERPRSPEPRLVAKALFNFVGQSQRELTFKKGDIIYIRRQIDKNWYEGELNAALGLFPSNYVEIVPYDGMKSTPPRKSNEGQARAKYNFIAQSHLELSLAKGELVVVTRRVDDNWFEGRIGGRKGIFPASYVEILVDPQDGQSAPPPVKPVASPAAHSLLSNGSAGGKESMGSHNYVPTFPTQDLGMSYRAKPAHITPVPPTASYTKKNAIGIDQALHIDIQNEPVAYKALYKYRPQNEDELELLEGDVVQVLEMCDDGWYVGTSERTGAFGTFPGNYVEKI